MILWVGGFWPRKKLGDVGQGLSRALQLSALWTVLRFGAQGGGCKTSCLKIQAVMSRVLGSGLRDAPEGFTAWGAECRT